MSVQVVPIAHVTPTYVSSTSFVRKMKSVLEYQGQIEPLQVRAVSVSLDGKVSYETFAQDTHGNDILCAARLLEWPSVIITVVKKFIE